MTVQEWLGKDNKLGIDIATKKYKQKDENAEQMLTRIADGDKEIKKIMENAEALPAGRVMANINTGKKGSMANCASIGYVDDDLASIMKANTDIAMTFKAQGGQGLSLSKLRPKGCGINKGQFESDGIVPFMEIFNRTTESISQGGSRKGALLMSLDIWHKEAPQFITIKSEEGRIQKANLSLEINDDFMNDVEKYYKTGEIVKRTITRDYEGNKVTYEVVPIELYKLMIKTAYDWAEPGCIFTDRFRNYNLMEYCDDYKIETCNPCGEQPLPKHGTCNLGSINLSKFVNNPFSSNAKFDSARFIKVTRAMVRYLDHVIDKNLDNHALSDQKEMVYNYRNVGLGIMGLHDCLIKMGLTYGSPESLDFTDKVMYNMFKAAFVESVNLAKEKGAFPKYTSNLLKAKIVRKHFTQKELENIGATVYGVRNCSLLSIAPVGSIGSMLNVSTGCEPLFAISYTRKTESLNNNTDKYYKVYSGIAKEYMEKFGNDNFPDYFIESKDINWKDRINMQSVLQKHVDTAISSTINLPHDISLDEIEKLYLYAWMKGLKGVTIYRDGCKRSGILSTNDNKQKENKTVDNEIVDIPRGFIIKADDNCIGKKRSLITGCGTLHCEAFFDPDTGNLLETYLSKGSSGGCVDADTEYFNGKEWKRIADYKRGSGEKVLQYCEDGTAELVEPIHYIVNENIDTLKHFTNKYGLDMVLSEDHRMYMYKNYRKYSMGMRDKLTTEITTVAEYLNRNNKKERHIPTTFSFKAPGIPVKDDYIRLLVAIYADGYYDGQKIVVSFKKERKKERFRMLLKMCDIGWTERNIYNTEYTYFYVHPVPSILYWFIDKQFTKKWYNCTDEQLKVVIDECVHWDGSIEKDNRLGAYYSSKKEEIDFIQFALHRLGYRATISSNNSSNSDKPSYRIRWTKQNVHNLKYAEVTDYKTIDGRSYCFTVPSGLLVLRRDNKIFVTGNCNQFMIGLSRLISLAARGGIDIYSIVDQLRSSGTCPSYAVRTATKHDTSLGSSCPVAVGNALYDMFKEIREDLGIANSEDCVNSKIKFSKTEKNNIKVIGKKDKEIPCPECGSPLVFEGGCNTCKNCGWSKCE